MKSKSLDQYLELAMPLIESIDCSAKHVSFVVRKNEIVAVGINRKDKTHPLAKKYGTRFNTIHSELDAILRASKKNNFKSCDLINVRLSSDSCRKRRPIMRNSKPCSSCMKLILASPQIRNVFYTTDTGWKKL